MHFVPYTPPASRPARVAAAPAEPPFLWVPGLPTGCAASLEPGAPNYFANFVTPPAKYWLVGVQAEASLNATCAGTPAHSLPINAGGPLTLAREPDQGGTSLRLRENFIDYPHPCPGETWTWFSIMDHVSCHGGPFPAPERAEIYARVVYNEVCGTAPTRLGALSGISRMGITAQAYWGGLSHLVDVVLYLHPAWGDAHPAADIIQTTTIPGLYTYTALNGAHLVPACSVVLNHDQGVVIPINRILADLVRRGVLPAPTGETAFVSCGAFLEIHTLAHPAACGDLHVLALQVF